MKIREFELFGLFILMFFLSQGVMAGQSIPMQSPAGNPCSTKAHNPCNPCGAKHSMNACNPCGAKHGMNACNPCGAKHAMKSSNPCNGGGDAIDPKKISRPMDVKRYQGEPRQQLVGYGEKLFKDTSLSGNGLSCNDCHATNDLFNAGFGKPYPHPVSMAKQRAGVSRDLNTDEFVQFCMLAPMESKTLPWDSRELAALAAYVEDVKQPAFRQWAKTHPAGVKKISTLSPMNPCSAKKAMANPCNPCAMKKMSKNPCNPCAGAKH